MKDLVDELNDYIIASEKRRAREAKRQEAYYSSLFRMAIEQNPEAQELREYDSIISGHRL